MDNIKSKISRILQNHMYKLNTSTIRRVIAKEISESMRDVVIDITTNADVNNGNLSFRSLSGNVYNFQNGNLI